MDSVYGDKTLKRTQIYDILKKVKEGKNTDDQRHKNPKKTVRTAAMIASVAAAIEEDRRRDIRSLASAHGTTVWTISTILHQDLGLVKKSARWVPKLLSDAQTWFAANNVQRLEHPPYSPDLAPADFFLFRKVKEELAGLSLTADSLKQTWEGVIRGIAAEDFATAFQRWHERCEKCIRIGGDYVEKT